MLRREAATWLARLQSGRDPGIEGKFERWLDAHPRNRDAFARVQRSYQQAGLLRHSQLVDRIGEPQAVPSPARRPRLALAGAVAVGVAFSGGVLALVALLPLGSGIQAMTLVTKAGEVRRVRLADGSNLTLDTSTKVDLTLGRTNRSAHLHYGRARFEIASSDQPFVIETSGAIVSTRQGTIEVEKVGRHGQVEVLAGSARVQGEGQPPLDLGPHQGLAIDLAGKGHVESVAQAPDWNSGTLQFDGTPIADAVELANLYSEQKVRVAGNPAALRVTGAFRAGDTLGLAKALAAAFGLDVNRSADGSLVLTVPSSLKKSPVGMRGGPAPR